MEFRTSKSSVISLISLARTSQILHQANNSNCTGRVSWKDKRLHHASVEMGDIHCKHMVLCTVQHSKRGSNSNLTGVNMTRSSLLFSLKKYCSCPGGQIIGMLWPVSKYGMSFSEKMEAFFVTLESTSHVISSMSKFGANFSFAPHPLLVLTSLYPLDVVS